MNLLAWRLTGGHSEYGTENLSFIKCGKVTVWVSDCQLLKKCPFALHYITACLLVCGYCLLRTTQLAKLQENGFEFIASQSVVYLQHKVVRAFA